MRPVSVTEFAAERQVSRTRVYQWLADGRIARLDGTGQIDADDAHARLKAHLDQTKGIRRDGNVTSSGPAGAAAAGRREEGGDQRDLLDASRHPPERAGAGAAPEEAEEGYWQHKTRSAKADAELKEMQVLERAGALTSAEAVRKEASETARMLRNALLAIPDRLAPVLDPASPSRAHKLLTDELQKVIRELIGRLDERAAGAAALQPDTALV